MKTKLSHSSVTMYNDCSKKYDLYYNQRIRSKKVRSALLFGKALDAGLNALLEGKNLGEAEGIFLKNWNHTEINGEKINVYQSELVSYSKSDTDEELLEWAGMPETLENKAWSSLLLKGELMLQSYHKHFMPLVEKVIALQKQITLKNAEGDEIVGFVDLIVQFKDGSTYLLDNKSSSVKYSDESPRESQQLVLYYYIEKDNIKLNGIGFPVLNKNINKNRKKICSRCNHDGSKGRHLTCNNEINGKRCGGKWNVSINPEADFTLILNTVTPEDEERVINSFDLANEGISKGEFKENYNACIGKYGKCEYYNYCHGGSAEGLIQIEYEEK